MTVETLRVELGERSYPIYIGENLLDDASLLTRHIRGRQVLVVSNDVVGPLYLRRVEHSLRDFERESLILPDGEQYKDLDTANRIFDTLLEKRFSRNCTLIALGGGVIGDITGFGAACYQRGVDFIQIPTTLLAQVDSSVGGKTGVNHRLGKNMIGAFHQPLCVVADTKTLDTLEPRQLHAGIAEVIKYGLIRDPVFFDWLEENINALMRREPAALAYAIRRSCENKAEVVAADEREAGQRALLNLGHTFGHAIETGTGYGNWLHGEAVACGMYLAARLSAAHGWLSEAEVERIEAILTQSRLPVLPPASMDRQRFLELMAVDKKNVDKNLRLVLMKAIGEAFVSDDFDHGKLRDTLDDALRQTLDTSGGTG